MLQENGWSVWTRRNGAVPFLLPAKWLAGQYPDFESCFARIRTFHAFGRARRSAS